MKTTKTVFATVHPNAPVTLKCTQGKSNKEYRIIIEPTPNGTVASVVAYFGRIGAHLQRQLKAKRLTIGEANALQTRIIGEKLAKGYVNADKAKPVKPEPKAADVVAFVKSQIVPATPATPAAAPATPATSASNWRTEAAKKAWITIRANRAAASQAVR